MKLNYDNIFIFGVLFILITVFVGGCGLTIYDQKHKGEVIATVTDLQLLQKISGSGSSMKTEIRFIVITDKETFITENSLFNFKFNNSDIFYRLEKGKAYKFKVCGIGKGIFTDYRNILEYSPQWKQQTNTQ